jgi:hypothetical protein
MGLNKYSDFESFEEMAKAEEQETVPDPVSKETDEKEANTDEPTKTE